MRHEGGGISSGPGSGGCVPRAVPGRFAAHFFVRRVLPADPLKGALFSMELSEFFARNPKAALAFSGGTDSALLLLAGVRAGARIQPYFVASPFQPAFERRDAEKLAAQAGVELRVIQLDTLADPLVCQNGPRRCYYCKKAVFTALRKQAAADGYTLLLDGTNASDDAADRPGMQALTELNVRSPLRECGITKRQVRRLSKEMGLFTWQKPSYACLATRIPTGTPITPEDLARVEKAESCLAQRGYRDFRVRLRAKDACLLQLTEEQWDRAAAEREALRTLLRPYFAQVWLDTATRTAEPME